jgi:DUF2075 family protein/predicted GIY-YIG superfamily endonuclease
MKNNELKIEQHEFNDSISNEFHYNPFANDLWPIVYILSDDKTKKAYVGETTDVIARMKHHLKNHNKSKLTTVHLITHEMFNKSATLDIESNLIKYMSADEQYILQNANIGIANHEYYQKNIYSDIFKVVWNQLMSLGITKHDLSYLDNSDLFKYSPYKNLTIEQSEGLYEVLSNLIGNNKSRIIVNGSAGTGKTILAIFIFKILMSDLSDFNFKEFGPEEEKFETLIKSVKEKYKDPKIALVVPMASFRKTLEKVFKNIKGLNKSMVIGPNKVCDNDYDLVLVDESHRLRRRVNLGPYFSHFDKACKKLDLDKNKTSELEWVLLKSKKSIFFYDKDQSIKPSDVNREDFIKLISSDSSSMIELKSQFRVKAGNSYVDFVDSLLNCELPKQKKYISKNYEFFLFESIDLMIDLIEKKNAEKGLSRLIAGYSWPWESKKDESKFDIKIESTELKWNSKSLDWINSDNSLKEVGCIHTTQGYDLNYSGIIFGNEISYDPQNEEILINEENYFDKNGKNTIRDPQVLKKYILNIYKTILLRGIEGTFVYVCDKNLREYFKKHIPIFHSEETTKTEIKIIPFDKAKPFVDSIPLLNIKASAGQFSSLQNPEDIDWLILPNDQRIRKEYFACQVIGDSMNKVIPNGSYCLFSKDTGGSRNGRIVLVQHHSIQENDLGAGYTVKLYQSTKTVMDGGWRHERVTLIPNSTNPKHEKIVLEDSQLQDFRVIGIFEKVLFQE